MQLLIIGGDARNRCLAMLARARGHSVQLVGHGEIPLSKAIPSSCAVLPFPFAEVDGYAPAPLSDERLDMESVCALLEPHATVYARKPGPILSKYILSHGCTRVDFMDSEAFTVRNAVPSAEGAIFALMSRSEACIDSSKCLIVGYGRIGRALAQRLKGLGAGVVVAARSASTRANAEIDGMKAIPLERMGEVKCRFLINTVPAQVIGLETLAALGPDVLALDLASAPFGFDLAMAQAVGMIAWREQSLPGRYAPETAAAAMLALIEEKDGA